MRFSALQVACPFCSRPGLKVQFKGALGKEDLAKQEEEEQRVLALQIRMREEEIARDQARAQERAKRRAEGLPDLGARRCTTRCRHG